MPLNNRFSFSLGELNLNIQGSNLYNARNVVREWTPSDTQGTDAITNSYATGEVVYTNVSGNVRFWRCINDYQAGTDEVGGRPDNDSTNWAEIQLGGASDSDTTYRLSFDSDTGVVTLTSSDSEVQNAFLGSSRGNRLPTLGTPGDQFFLRDSYPLDSEDEVTITQSATWSDPGRGNLVMASPVNQIIPQTGVIEEAGVITVQRTPDYRPATVDSDFTNIGATPTAQNMGLPVGTPIRAGRIVRQGPVGGGDYEVEYELEHRTNAMLPDGTYLWGRILYGDVGLTDSENFRTRMIVAWAGGADDVRNANGTYSYRYTLFIGNTEQNQNRNSGGETVVTEDAADPVVNFPFTANGLQGTGPEGSFLTTVLAPADNAVSTGTRLNLLLQQGNPAVGGTLYIFNARSPWLLTHSVPAVPSDSEGLGGDVVFNQMEPDRVTILGQNDAPTWSATFTRIQGFTQGTTTLVQAGLYLREVLGGDSDSEVQGWVRVAGGGVPGQAILDEGGVALRYDSDANSISLLDSGGGVLSTVNLVDKVETLSYNDSEGRLLLLDSLGTDLSSVDLLSGGRGTNRPAPGNAGERYFVTANYNATDSEAFIETAELSGRGATDVVTPVDYTSTRTGVTAVSYTHLTLPTILRV